MELKSGRSTGVNTTFIEPLPYFLFASLDINSVYGHQKYSWERPSPDYRNSRFTVHSYFSSYLHIYYFHCTTHQNPRRNNSPNACFSKGREKNNCRISPCLYSAVLRIRLYTLGSSDSFSNILPDAWIFMCQAQLFKRKYNVGDSWFQIIPM